MTKRQLQIKANKDFISRVQAKFSEWCSKKGKHPTQDNFVSYLIRHNFIDETIINRFLCLEYYNEELPKTVNPKRAKGAKILAVWSLEDKLPLKETAIKSNLRHHKRFFNDKPHKLP
jgi:hypothetical protein